MTPQGHHNDLENMQKILNITLVGRLHTECLKGYTDCRATRHPFCMTELSHYQVPCQSLFTQHVYLMAQFHDRKCYV